MGSFKEILLSVFENLGVEFYSTEMFFRKWFYVNGVEKGEKGEEGFITVALCISVRQTNYLCATTLPRYGMGLSSKFVCFSAGSLILYKGLWHLGKLVHATLESELTPSMGQHISRHIPSHRKTLGFSRHGARVTLWRRYCRGVQGR
jgi:hypothetical protein